MTKGLTDQEIRALRSMPAFNDALLLIEQADLEEALAAQKAKDELHTPCEGSVAPVVGDLGYTCPKCGLELKYREYASKTTMESVIRGNHWKHKNGGNPALESGLYGKAAMAAAGDWYGSH